MNENHNDFVEVYRGFIIHLTASRLLKADAVFSFAFVIFGLLFYTRVDEMFGMVTMLVYPALKLFMSAVHEVKRQRLRAIMDLMEKRRKSETNQ